jgi:branched-chain amino acid transport system ATP-binding protein
VLDLGRVLTIGAPQDVVRDPAVIRAYLGDRYAAPPP